MVAHPASAPPASSCPRGHAGLSTARRESYARPGRATRRRAGDARGRPRPARLHGQRDGAAAVRARARATWSTRTAAWPTRRGRDHADPAAGRLRGGPEPARARGTLRRTPGVHARRRHRRRRARGARRRSTPARRAWPASCGGCSRRRTAAGRAGAAAARLGVPWCPAPDPAARGLRGARRRAARPGAPDVPRWAARLGAAVAPDALAGAALPGWARAPARGARAGAARAGSGPARRPSEADRLLALRRRRRRRRARRRRPAVLGWWGATATAGPRSTARTWCRGRRPRPRHRPGACRGACGRHRRPVGGRDEQLALALRLAREGP